MSAPLSAIPQSPASSLPPFGMPSSVLAVSSTPSFTIGSTSITLSAPTKIPESSKFNFNVPTYPTTSERFRDGDTKFRSRNNVIFHIHQKYLELAAEGFPSSFSNGLTATAKFDEIIPLTEMSATLDLLFQFVYPKDQPDLLHLEFQAVMDLAKAAEKYVVYNAINVCQFRIKDFLPDHLEEIFNFAAAHDHATLLAAVAPLMVHKPLEQVAYKLSADMYKPWSLYHDLLFRTCYKVATNAGPPCPNQQCEIEKYRRLVLESPELSTLQRIVLIPRQSSCDACCARSPEWREKSWAEVRAMPDFKAILKRHREMKAGF
ncbi:hypothetical protein VKT23_015005 [Stygiomarasmius scandens]|uniref:BTB domain-containing protein n=1 Tax=Marasmiellus scandens TaxID=2682957 RepID=A0ABR1J3L8_9AGAR